MTTTTTTGGDEPIAISDNTEVIRILTAAFFIDMMVNNREPGAMTSVSFKDIKPLACN